MAGRQRANGEGSIRERYPGCWEGRYTAGYDILTGKRIQKGVFAKTRKECAAKLARAIQQDTGPYYRKGKGYDSQPLSTWIRLWFDSNLRPSSADGYRSMIENHIIPVLGHIQLSKLSSIQIQRFYNDLHTQGRLDNHGNRKYEPLSASTVKHIHAVLSGALKQAVKERIIPFNPCDNCKIPKREKKEMHVLPQDKIGAYLDEAKRLGVYALFYLELTSGLRRGELLGLEWADLNPETRMLTVNKQLTRSGGELCISVPKTEGQKLAGALKVHVDEYDVDVIDSQSASKLIPAAVEGGLHQIETASGAVLKARSIIVATGAKWRNMNVPGEDQYRTKGVTYCPHCDGPLFKGKRVAVIGGGNSGVEAAIDLAGIVEHVTLLEFAPEMKADQVLQDKLRSLKNVDIILNAQTTEVKGDGSKVVGLEYRDRVSGDIHNIELAGIFVQIGLLPNTNWLEGAVERNRMGEIIIDAKCETNVKGVFAAGDCTTVPYKQIIIATGEGAKASLSAFDYLIRTKTA